MFARLEETIILNKNLSDGAIRLYALILIRGHKEGRCKYKIDTFARELGWGRSKVKMALSELYVNNLITKTKGRGASNYELRGSEFHPSNALRGSEFRPPEGRNFTPLESIDYIDSKDFLKKKTAVAVTVTKTASPKVTEGEEKEGIGQTNYSEITDTAVKDLASKVMDIFNAITGSHYSKKNYNMRFIVERIYQGAEELEFRTVIRGMNEKWKGDEKMKNFIRPQTLFSQENFGDYLSEFNEINSKG